MKKNNMVLALLLCFTVAFPFSPELPVRNYMGPLAVNAREAESAPDEEDVVFMTSDASPDDTVSFQPGAASAGEAPAEDISAPSAEGEVAFEADAPPAEGEASSPEAVAPTAEGEGGVSASPAEASSPENAAPVSAAPSSPAPTDGAAPANETPAPTPHEAALVPSATPIPPDTIVTNLIPGWPEGPSISSSAAFLMEAGSGTVLYAKNAESLYYPSSSVKVMTCLLAIEKCALDEEVVMTATGANGVMEGDAAISAQIDEVFTMEQCLYAITLASANDMALQVAEHVGGSVEAFVAMMNERAAELGCKNTLFTNPTGLPDDKQHTTPEDLAIITREALSNPTYRRICLAQNYIIPATNLSYGERILTNRFSLVIPGNDYYYDGCVGGKEGYTDSSGNVLTCMAKRGDMTLVLVIMKGSVNATDSEAIQLLDYGFDQFRFEDVGLSDFHVIDGGKLLLPADADVSAIREENVREGNVIVRTYYLNDLNVGTAMVELPPEEDTRIVAEAQAKMEEARAFSDNHASWPYFAIVAAGIVGVLLIILCIRRVLHGKAPGQDTPENYSSIQK